MNTYKGDKMVKKILLMGFVIGMSTVVSAGVNDKTVVKNVNINTDVRSGQVNVGKNAKLNLGSVKIGKGSTVEGGSINSMVNTGDVKLGQGAQADIGGVDIGH